MNKSFYNQVFDRNAPMRARQNAPPIPPVPLSFSAPLQPVFSHNSVPYFRTPEEYHEYIQPSSMRHRSSGKYKVRKSPKRRSGKKSKSKKAKKRSGRRH